MSSTWQPHRNKNWQWRIIIWTSLFLIFAKDLGHWAYHALAIDQAYYATTSIANKAGLTTSNRKGLSQVYEFTNEAPAISQMVIDVKNDTPNDYTIETKTSSGHVNFIGHSFSAGNTKRLTIKPDLNNTEKQSGIGDILFLSAPMAGSANTTCQEIHTLNFDLKDANQVNHTLVVNLSSIASKMECNENAGLNVD